MSGSFAPRPDDHLVEPLYSGLQAGRRHFGFKSNGDEPVDQDAVEPPDGPQDSSEATEPAQPMGTAHAMPAGGPLPPVRNSPASVLKATVLLLAVIVVGMAAMFLFGY